MMTNLIRSCFRNLTTSRFDAKAAQAACWICSLLVLVVGVLKLTRLQLTETELFLSILLVLAVAILCLITGLLMPIVEYVSQKKNTDA